MSESSYHPHSFGKHVEEQVCLYLQQQGLILVQTNYCCKLGEIDLIMQDNDCYVFVEVRARANQDFLASLESVDRYKQNKIIRAATFYLQQAELLEKVFCRFDVVAVKQERECLAYNWIKNAFEVW